MRQLTALVALGWCLALAVAPVSTQTPSSSTLTDEEVDGAITWGLSKSGHYDSVSAEDTGGWSVTLVGPTQLIANMAVRARVRYEPFSRSDVRPILRERAITVQIRPLPPSQQTGWQVPAAADKAVVRLPGVDSAVVSATDAERVAVVYQNAMGARWESGGLTLRFPWDRWPHGEALELVIVTSDDRRIVVALPKDISSKLK